MAEGHSVDIQYRAIFETCDFSSEQRRVVDINRNCAQGLVTERTQGEVPT
jgi:hypothetical protein